MIFYFSGTGNSRWVAESLGKRLGDAVEDIADVKIEKEEYRGSRNLVGIAIQLSDSEEEKLFVHDSMQVSPE